MNIAFVLALAMLPVQPALAGGCDYRPSEVLGAEKVIALPGGLVGTGGAVSSKFDVKFDELYSITNGTTNKPMIGSKGPGPSAAGTQGIVKGSHGTLKARLLAVAERGSNAKIGNILSGAGVVAFEAGCWFLDNRRNAEGTVQSAAQ